MKNGGGNSIPASAPVPGKHRRLKIFLLASGIVVLLLFLTVIFSLTPYALRSWWLPFAANLSDAKMEASDLRIESFFPLRLEMKNFHYSDGSGTVIDAETARTGIRLRRLFKGTIDLKDTYISNMKLVVRNQPPDAPSISSASLPKESASAEQPPLIMHIFKAEHVTFVLNDPFDKPRQQWTIRSIQGDRLLPREKCILEGEAEIKTFPSPNDPVLINSLPFRMNAVFVLEDNYRLEAFQIELKTGVVDMVLLNNYAFPAGMGLSLNLSADGKFLEDGTLLLHTSELFLIKEKKSIGKLTLSGELGKRFQCKGMIQDLNAGPLISFLFKNKNAALTIRQADFHFEGKKFTEESLQSELIGELKLQAEALSVPVELDSKSRLFRLVLIPLEALPSFINLAKLKLEFKKEMNACLSSINDAVSGKRNLEFDKASVDLALDRGSLNVRDISLRGKDIEMESIQGKLDMPTGNLNMKSLLVICGVKIPLTFEGTLNQPSVNLFAAAKDFISINTPLLKTIKEEASKIIPSDTAVEKAVKRGLKNLDKFLTE